MVSDCCLSSTSNSPKLEKEEEEDEEKASEAPGCKQGREKFQAFLGDEDGWQHT